MKLNKLVAPNFKIETPEYFKVLKTVLLIIAITSTVLNTALSISLGIKTLLIILVSCWTFVEAECLFNYHNKAKSRVDSLKEIKENHAYLDGLMLALLLPTGTPIYAVVISAFFASFIVRNLFGGYSFNVFSVAVVGAIFARISWTITAVFTNALTDRFLINVFPIADPETVLFAHTVGINNIDMNGFLFYDTASFLGSVPNFILIALFIFMVYKKTVDIVAPLSMIISFVIFSYLLNLTYGVDGFIMDSFFISMFLFSSLFLISDVTMLPLNRNPRIMYGILAAFITILIREFSSNIDGVLYAVLFANMFRPYFNEKSKQGKNSVRYIKVIIVIVIMLVTTYFTPFVTENDPSIIKTELKTYSKGDL